MNLPLFIARRYFFSRKIANVIHIISLISLIGVGVGSFALIVVLSVFNGFEEVVVSLYNSFDPDLRITPARGKYFHPDSSFRQKLQDAEILFQNDSTEVIQGIRDLEEVNGATYLIEENALLKYSTNQTIATIKAIEEPYVKSIGLDSMIYLGSAKLKEGDLNKAIVGSGIATKLDLRVYDEVSAIQVYVPKKGKPGFSLTPGSAFNNRAIQASGIFSIQQDFDEKYVLVPLSFMRDLVKEPERINGLEINFSESADIEAIQKEWEKALGEEFILKNRYQQHAWLYKVMRTEKMAVYLILSFILLIAAFNLIGSLLMLAIEKRKDMAILKSMGATPELIRNIFFFEGLLLSAIGGGGGLSIGVLVCFLQQKYGLVKINAGQTFVLDAYPINFLWSDFILVFSTVVILGLLASYYPARTAYRQLKVSDIYS